MEALRGRYLGWKLEILPLRISPIAVRPTLWEEEVSQVAMGPLHRWTSGRKASSLGSKRLLKSASLGVDGILANHTGSDATSGSECGLSTKGHWFTAGRLNALRAPSFASSVIAKSG